MHKTILITGASAGIGKETAKLFHANGWQVAATMRRPEEEKELTQLSSVKCYRLDVTESDSIQTAIDAAIRDFGHIDVLLNNAGYGTLGPFEHATERQIQRQFDTNVFGLMRVTKAILPHFRLRKSGMIINVSSVAGRVAFPIFSLYHGTKWAVEGYSESLRYELAPFGIRVKLIEPGAIHTDFGGRSMDWLTSEGDDPYARYVHTVKHNMDKAVTQAGKPIEIAKAIFKAANDKSGRLRYAVGGGAPALLVLRGLLPLRWFTGLVKGMLERPSKTKEASREMLEA